MTVTIRRTYTEGKGLEQFIGKTRGSIRTISLSEAAMAVYRAQRQRCPDSALVFPAQRGGYINLRNWRQRDWQPALEAAGLEQRVPNALRHPFATWFLLHSDDRWLLAKLMGTGVDMIELHYGHLIATHANRNSGELFGRKLDAKPNRYPHCAAGEPSDPAQPRRNQRSPLTDSNR
jgi:integrase